MLLIRQPEKSIYFIFLVLLLFTSTNCMSEDKAIKTEIRLVNGSYKLFRAGKPYYIKGAGGTSKIEKLSAYGGNSIRTWSTDKNTRQLLDEAHKHGISVTLGLHVERERHGFDYNNQEAVKKQLERLKQEVLKYKDHPALLMWGIGNELNLHYTNPKVWNAVNEISKMIHDIDPNHLSTTMSAGLDKQEIAYINDRCKDLDLMCFQMYGNLPALPDMVRAYGWKGAYVVTEWGPTGHWEVPKTEWGVAIEETSSQKAIVYKERYEESMLKDTIQCVGSYVFLWGQKQERTPTWYGLFLENGNETEVMDVMHFLWKGEWPSNKAPHIESMVINGKNAYTSIYVKPGEKTIAQAIAFDPENENFSIRWELLPESTDLKDGGDPESRPVAIKGVVDQLYTSEITFSAPTMEGAYRLFVYITDGNNKAATGNIPFYVKK